MAFLLKKLNFCFLFVQLLTADFCWPKRTRSNDFFCRIPASKSQVWVCLLFCKCKSSCFDLVFTWPPSWHPQWLQVIEDELWGRKEIDSMTLLKKRFFGHEIRAKSPQTKKMPWMPTTIREVVHHHSLNLVSSGNLVEQLAFETIDGNWGGQVCFGF